MNARSQVDINIQTVVETNPMSGPYEAARAYIEYRHDRDIQREKRGRSNQKFRGPVEQTNSALLNENANKDSKVMPHPARFAGRDCRQTPCPPAPAAA